jgi:hypothetical protein
MRMKRSDMPSAVINDKIFAIGGYSDFELRNHVEYFNEEENKWFVYS